jgi:hypothetical protein
MTDLDRAHAAMESAPDDPLPRLRFYEALAEADLTLWLAAEPPPGADPVPALFDTADGRFALVFDSDERLASFAEGPAAYAALPGRALVQMLAGQGVGLGLNLGVAPSSFLMPADSVDWLAQALAPSPVPATARPESLGPPSLPETVIAALDRKLGRSAGLAVSALLSGADWGGGRKGHVLAVIGARPGAEEPLAQAISEALTFSGQDRETLDVVFLAADDPLAARIARQALRLDLPGVEVAPSPSAPGSDPSRPPRLR